MGGLAYMTGPAGQPLRAGTSVVDHHGRGLRASSPSSPRCAGATATGRGELVKSALFESTVFMMGQHMAGEAITGRGGAADAGAPRRLGHLPDLRDGRWRADLRRRHQRPVTGRASARSSPGPTSSPIRGLPPTRRGWRRGPGCCRSSRSCSAASPRPRSPRAASGRAFPTRRWPARPISSTIPISTPGRGWWRRRCPAASAPSCRGCRSSSRASGRGFTARRRGAASTRARCWAMPAGARRRSPRLEQQGIIAVG